MGDIQKDVPEIELQKTIVSVLIAKEPQIGEDWYLIDIMWFKKWKKYIGYYSQHSDNLILQRAAKPEPGPVDNSNLINVKTKTLKIHLVHEKDYELIPKEAWDLLSSWFGTIPGQKHIKRKVVECGMYVKYKKVEVYPLLLKFFLHRDKNDDYYVIKEFSRGESVRGVQQTIRSSFNISESTPVRFWTEIYGYANDLDVTIEEAGWYSSAHIVIETQDNNGIWSGKYPKVWSQIIADANKKQ